MTKNEKYIVDMYVRYFGRAADAATIATYAEDKKTSVILKNIIADADAEKAELSTSDFVNNAFQNLFGRNATTKEMNKYSKVIEKGKNLPIQSIVKSATKTDKAVYDNKIAVANKNAELGGAELDLSKISKGNTVDLNKVFTLTDLTNAIGNLADNSGIPSSFDGKTFVLTTGVDAGKDFTGTNKGDLFIADNSVAGTVNASAADTLDGGKGVDTFKLYDDTATTTGSIPTLKNIENVVIYDNKLVGAVNLTKWDTVETLFLVRSANTAAYALGEKVTTVNIEDKAVATTLTFDKDLTAATLGVNKVTAGTTTVNGTALKTLTVDAYGKDSIVTLAQTTGAIETLNITGKANLDLTLGAGLGTSIITVDGSKAQGDLKFSNTANMTSIKTGSGNDTVNVAAAVASGETINLGAGNDKLVKSGAGVVDTSTTTVIDGGAGIDSLDSALVTVGNAGVFANFEIISLTAANTPATALDMDLLTKSTITSIAKDDDQIHFVKNVQKSQSLTINTNVANATTLLFKDVTGTADAYTINFAKDADAGAGTTVDANTVTIDGIETVIVNSTGLATTTKNIIDLDADAAKSLVITGDKAIDVTFTQFGSATAATATNGLGVSTIDASASTAGITIADLTTATGNLNVAWSGLTIKGGAGVDTITTGNIEYAININSGAGDDILDLSTIDGTVPAVALTKADINVNAGAGNDTIKVAIIGGTYTLGAGKDIINVKAAVATGNTAATSVYTTITDIEKGDKIEFTAGGSNLFAKADITGANNLDAALGLAAAGTAGATTWFQYDGKTYIVDNDTTGGLSAVDVVVELNGIVDLGNSALATAAGTSTLTIA